MDLTSAQFHSLFTSFDRSVFRLQLLAEYRIEEESVEFASFLAGDPRPDHSHHPWIELITHQVAAGRSWTNIHALPSQLTPYLRYLIGWWYVDQQRAGATIGLLAPEESAHIKPLATHDFWLFDDETLVILHYDGQHRFLRAEERSTPDSLAAARRARDFAVAHAEDLTSHLARQDANPST